VVKNLTKLGDEVFKKIAQRVGEFIRDKAGEVFAEKTAMGQAAKAAAKNVLKGLEKKIMSYLGKTFMKEFIAKMAAQAAVESGVNWIPGVGQIIGGALGAAFTAQSCLELIEMWRAAHQKMLDDFEAEVDKATLEALVKYTDERTAHFEFYGFVRLKGSPKDEWNNATVGCDVPGKYFYLVSGQLFGCNGGGDLYKVNKTTGKFSKLEKCLEEWRFATVMTYCKKNGYLYIVCGQMGNTHGHGGLYKVNKDTGNFHRIGESSTEWVNATTMTSCGGSLYIVCGRMGGADGGGSLFKVDPNDGRFHEIGKRSEWKNATTMTSCGNHLYITCGKMNGVIGAGGLWRVNKDNGKFDQIGPNEWSNATTMCSRGGLLYITCGHMGGRDGDGGLFEVDPDTGNYRRLGYLHEWETATVMVGGEEGVFIACGEREGCPGSGLLYQAKVNYNAALLSKL